MLFSLHNFIYKLCFPSIPNLKIIIPHILVSLIIIIKILLFCHGQRKVVVRRHPVTKRKIGTFEVSQVSLWKNSKTQKDKCGKFGEELDYSLDSPI